MVMRRDGQSHSVDSNEIAFRTAAKMAVLASMMKANPLLLGTRCEAALL